MNLVQALTSKRWIIASLLVIAGAAVCIRLGIWQLDRLEKRRAFNTRVQAQLNAPVLDLTNSEVEEPAVDMEYRKVTAVGRYDFEHQIVLKNQYYGNEWGVHLVTPLIMDGSEKVVLVDRGWIPAADFESGDWRRYDENGRILVNGMIRSALSKAEMGSRRDIIPTEGEPPLKAWFFINIEQISKQMPYPLIPIYIQQASDGGQNELPFRTQPTLELTEGPHMGYALQWFSFAGILLIGYPFYVRKQGSRAKPRELKPAKHPVSTGI